MPEFQFIKFPCGHSVKWKPGFKWNSSIKLKPPTECKICKNKDLLSQSTLYSKKQPSRYGTTNKTGNKKESPKTLAMKRADRWFSIYIRIKYAYKIQDGDVFCQCIVERNVIKLAKHMDNGHCFSRGNKPTRYCEDNCRPQNRSSNRYKGEEHHYIFIDHLTEEIGQERFDAVDKLRREDGEDNVFFYTDQADKYKKLVKKLAEEHGIKKWW